MNLREHEEWCPAPIPWDDRTNPCGPRPCECGRDVAVSRLVAWLRQTRAYHAEHGGDGLGWRCLDADEVDAVDRRCEICKVIDEALSPSDGEAHGSDVVPTSPERKAESASRSEPSRKTDEAE